MIIRRTTRVAAGLRCQGAQRGSAPERRPRGPAKRGSGSGGDARPHQNTDGAPTARYGVASSFGRHCSRPTRSPQSVARGAREAGIGQRRGCQTAPKYRWGAYSPLRGRIFLRKTLLPPYAVSPERRPRGPAKRGSGCLRGLARFYRIPMKWDLFGNSFAGLYPRLIEAAFGIRIQQARSKARII
jgi:hypothetical protein